MKPLKPNRVLVALAMAATLLIAACSLLPRNSAPVGDTGAVPGKAPEPRSTPATLVPMPAAHNDLCTTVCMPQLEV